MADPRQGRRIALAAIFLIIALTTELPLFPLHAPFGPPLSVLSTLALPPLFALALGLRLGGSDRPWLGWLAACTLLPVLASATIAFVYAVNLDVNEKPLVLFAAGFAAAPAPFLVLAAATVRRRAGAALARAAWRPFALVPLGLGIAARVHSDGGDSVLGRLVVLHPRPVALALAAPLFAMLVYEAVAASRGASRPSRRELALDAGLALAGLAVAALVFRMPRTRSPEEKCEAGDGDECDALAEHFIYGRSLLDDPLFDREADRDVPRGLALLGRACDAGPSTEYSPGQVGYWRSCADLLDELLDRDPARARAEFDARCAAGQAHTCVLLGYVLLLSTRVTLDPPHSLELFQRGCSLGDSEACGALGMMYARGVTGPANPARARVSFAQAECLTPNRPDDTLASCTAYYTRDTGAACDPFISTSCHGFESCYPWVGDYPGWGGTDAPRGSCAWRGVTPIGGACRQGFDCVPGSWCGSDHTCRQFCDLNVAAGHAPCPVPMTCQRLPAPGITASVGECLLTPSLALPPASKPAPASSKAP